MARFRLPLLVAGLAFPGVISFRVGVPPHALLDSLDASSLEEQGTAAGIGEAPPLKLFSTTYNAHNRYYDKASSADDMLQTLVRGHEEADIVMLGLQEYFDTCRDDSEISEHVRKDLLWSSHFEGKAQHLKELSRRAAPDNVVQARDAILQKFQTFHDRLHGEISNLKHFATHNRSFVEGVGANSPAAGFVDASLPATKMTEEKIHELLTSYEASKATAPKKQFGALNERLQAVQKVINEFNSQDFDVHFTEVTKWSKDMQREFYDFHQQHGNFELNQGARRQYKQLLDAFQEAPAKGQASLQSGERLDVLRFYLDKFQGAVETKAMQASEAAVKNQVAQWNKVLHDVERLEADLMATKTSNDVSNLISVAVTSMVLKQTSSLELVLDKWRSNVHESVNTLGNLVQLDLTHGDLEIPMISEVFDSGSRSGMCAAASHYNTDMRVFGNPWSPWKVNQAKTTKYSIDYNGKSSRWKFWDGQCGKGANVVKLTLEASTGHAMNLCLINTHQSYKFNFLHRLHNMQDTLASLQGGEAYNSYQAAPHNVRWSTTDLGCHATVYAADFNTRLVCQAPGGSTTAPLSGSPTETGNSFQNIVSTFCDPLNMVSTGSPCALGSSPKAQSDELTQFLTNDRLNCFEGKKDAWTLHSNVPNPLFTAKHKLREVAIPNFAPTYKLAYKKTYNSTYDNWLKCFDGEELCLLNKEQDAKHNPAWTDRILTRDSDYATVSSELYERRTYTSIACSSSGKKPKHCSDHGMVASILSITVQSPP